MNIRFSLIVITAVLTIFSLRVHAKEIKIKVIDGLGRPVPEVAIHVYWLKSFTEEEVREITLIKLKTDKNGEAKGNFNETTVPKDETIFYGINKEEYIGYDSSKYKPEFVLQREYKLTDLKKIIKLSGEALKVQLRELLAGRYDDINLPQDQVFIDEEKLRPALQSLITDAHISKVAIYQLAYIGVPEDLSLIVSNAPDIKNKSYGSSWIYQVVTTLFEPATVKDWLFLKNAAANAFDDLWADYGAIQTLKIIASEKSRAILNEVAVRNRNRAEEIQEAIKYIDSKPETIADKNLKNAGKKIAKVIKVGKWLKNSKPRFNKKKDKALIDCEFLAGRDWYLYTATFHKVDGIWKPRGIRETMQALRAIKL